jgi:pre-rRNA-processing protein TSR1
VFVTVRLLGVPSSVWEYYQKNGVVLIASGQLEHEQKWSALHFQIQRPSDFDEPLKSKTTLLAHIGFRKFFVSPLFSEPTFGDRTKFSRFFHTEDKFKVATFFGPITFAPSPILLFQVPSIEEERAGVPLRMVGYGHALPPNPDLLILKRSVLSGRIAVIHKKQIVVKHMFFNEDDVKWFQPVEIYTKFGRRGKITKPVGTHGLFKAVLSDQVMQHDVIMMDLWKRVFPKWTTVAYNIAELSETAENSECGQVSVAKEE